MKTKILLAEKILKVSDRLSGIKHSPMFDPLEDARELEFTQNWLDDLWKEMGELDDVTRDAIFAAAVENIYVRYTSTVR